MKQLSVILLMCLSFQVCADLNDAYKEGGALSNSHANDAAQSLKDLDINQFPGFDPNLPQQNYYGGVTQKNTPLETDAANALPNNEAGRAINESFNQRPFYQINNKSEMMQRLHEIADEGEDIMHGKASDKTTCSLQPKQCEYRWEEKICFSAKTKENLPCIRALHMELVPYKTESYQAYVRRDIFGIYDSMTVNLKNSNTCASPWMSCYTLYQGDAIAVPLALPADCARLKVSLRDEQGEVVVESEATCAAPSLTFKMWSQCKPNEPCTIAFFQYMTLTVEIFGITEYWDNQCLSLEQKTAAGFCNIMEPPTCLEPSETRQIGDIAYTRACWKEKTLYECGGESESTCTNAIEQGCEQSASVCVKEEAGKCLNFQQTYQCPQNHCTENQLICGDAAFCMEGDCSTHEYTPADETDFKKAMSSLSAASEAAKQFDGNANFIFKGERLECSTLMLGVKNCCRDSGWGIDLNLAHCNDEEKKLGQAKEKKLVVATGEYCYNRVEWPGGSKCVEHRKTYCGFQSKLARMVQEQGRRDQLGISFGSGQYPNCSGITPEQLAQVQFERIDFSEMFAEIKSRVKEPDYQKTTDAISQRMSDFYTQGVGHE